MLKAGEGGWIEVVCGSMFCGKSEELIRRIKRVEIAKKKVQVFKPAFDNRFDKDFVNSHDGNQVKAINVGHSKEIPPLLDDDTQVVAIDEL